MRDLLRLRGGGEKPERKKKSDEATDSKQDLVNPTFANIPPRGPDNPGNVGSIDRMSNGTNTKKSKKKVSTNAPRRGGKTSLNPNDSGNIVRTNSNSISKLEEQANALLDTIAKFKKSVLSNQTNGVRRTSMESSRHSNATALTSATGADVEKTLELLQEESRAKEMERMEKLVSQLEAKNKALTEENAQIKKQLGETKRQSQSRPGSRKQGSIVATVKRGTRESFSRMSGTPSRKRGISKDGNNLQNFTRRDSSMRMFGSSTFQEVSTTALHDPDEQAGTSRIKKMESLSSYEMQRRMTDDDSRAGFTLQLDSDLEHMASEIKTVEEGTIYIPHMTKNQVKLKWVKEPKVVLIIKRLNDPHATRMMLEISRSLQRRNMTALIETPSAIDIGSENMLDNMTPKASDEMENEPIDFIICLGGDGTLIWACSLFKEGLPPILSFKMGSLGFLSPFGLEIFEKTITDVLEKAMEITVRSRLQIKVQRETKGGKYKEETFTCLNEVVVDRGPSHNMVMLNLYSGETFHRREKITVVQGDGVIVATPTGSTAYSLSAGGSIVHPAIPGMVVTPIAPHSLSFRPIVVADSTFLMFEVPKAARHCAYVSFDGQHQIKLEKGDRVHITVSEYPVSSYCLNGETGDWYNAIKTSFLWNERTIQREHSKE